MKQGWKKGFMQPREEKAQRELITVSQCLKSGYREDGDSLFTRVCSDKTRGNGPKLFQEIFCLDIKKNFTIKTIKNWSKLPR